MVTMRRNHDCTGIAKSRFLPLRQEVRTPAFAILKPYEGGGGATIPAGGRFFGKPGGPACVHGG